MTHLMRAELDPRSTADCRQQSQAFYRQHASDMYARVRLGIMDPDDCVRALAETRRHLRAHRRKHLRRDLATGLTWFGYRLAMVLSGAVVVGFVIALAWIAISAAAFGFAPGVLGRP